MSESNKANREYRDRLFKFIFGNPDNKAWTLSLYNAVNGTNYENADDITFNTINSAVYMSMKNDVSFLVDDAISFYEQQSTYNPNMPMRFLIYAGMVYSKYIERNTSYHKYSRIQQYAPTPKCVCFYNGATDVDDRLELKLTDSFAQAERSDVELKVTMININYGHNRALMDACKPLKEYAWFVGKIRENREIFETLEEAVDAALNELADDSIIKPFLIDNKAEVKEMCITEYDEEKTFAQQRAEGVEEGRIEGRREGRIEGIKEGIKEGIIESVKKFIKKGKLSYDEIADNFDIPVEEVRRLAAQMS